MSRLGRCPSCGSSELQVFYEVRGIPTNSCIQLSSASEAKAYPTGDIELAYCGACEFISNLAFDPGLTEYSGRYEETQSYSPTFSEFHARLARDLIERYQLKGKRVIEIGCGKGEFLEMLCELGNNEGVGFDPGFCPDRVGNGTLSRVTFVQDFYSEAYARYQGDFVCCKMTLEHISDTREFVRVARKSIGDRPATLVFFQVPSVERILAECAFEDIYYEHCSYFSKRSLSGLFERCGFRVLNVRTEYDDQYLTIEALPVAGERNAKCETQSRPQLAHQVRDFADRMAAKRVAWNEQVGRALDAGTPSSGWAACSHCSRPR